MKKATFLSAYLYGQIVPHCGKGAAAVPTDDELMEDRYSSVMKGKGWMGYKEIAAAVGEAEPFVHWAVGRKLLNAGKVERRHVGSPNARGPVEFRWKDIT